MNHPPLLLLTLTSVIAIHSTDHTINKHQRRTQNVSEAFQSASSCPKSADEPRTECLAKEQTSRISVQCCRGKLGSNLSCKRPTCRYMNTYADAEAFCLNRRMRLCSVPELNSNECCNKGSGFNDEMTWTSSACSIEEMASIEKGATNPTPSPTTSPPTMEPSAPPTLSPSSTPSQHLLLLGSHQCLQHLLRRGRRKPSVLLIICEGNTTEPLGLWAQWQWYCLRI